MTYFSEKKYRKKREKVSENIMLNKVSLEHLKINEEIDDKMLITTHNEIDEIGMKNLK